MKASSLLVPSSPSCVCVCLCVLFLAWGGNSSSIIGTSYAPARVFIKRSYASFFEFEDKMWACVLAEVELTPLATLNICLLLENVQHKTSSSDCQTCSFSTRAVVFSFGFWPFLLTQILESHFQSEDNSGSHFAVACRCGGYFGIAGSCWFLTACRSADWIFRCAELFFCICTGFLGKQREKVSLRDGECEWRPYFNISIFNPVIYTT